MTRMELVICRFTYQSPQGWRKEAEPIRSKDGSVLFGFRVWTVGEYGGYSRNIFENHPDYKDVLEAYNFEVKKFYAID